MTTSGYSAPPPPPAGLWADTQAEAWALHRAHADTHGYPVLVGGRWLVPQAVRAVHDRYAMQATGWFMFRSQPQPPQDWRNAPGALLPGEGQAWAWYMAHKAECAGPPQCYDGLFWLVPTRDAKPRQVHRLKQEAITTPHKGSAAEAARLHEWDKGRISERASRRRRYQDDDDQPEQARLFG